MTENKVVSIWTYIVTIFVATLPIFSYAMQSPCLNDKFPLQQAPKCPATIGQSKISFLSHIYPTSALFIALNTESEGSILTVLHTLKRRASYIRVNLLFSDSEFKARFEKDLQKAELDKLVHFLQTEELYTFVRDPLLFATNEKGAPVIVKSPPNSYNFFPQLTSTVTKTCQFDVLDFSGVEQGGGAVEGGNFFAMPGNILITEGIGLFSDLIKAARSGDKRAFGTAEGKELHELLNRQERENNVYKAFVSTLSEQVPILENDVRSGSVFHIDENFSLVKTNNPFPCDFAVLVASPPRGA